MRSTKQRRAARRRAESVDKFKVVEARRVNPDRYLGMLPEEIIASMKYPTPPPTGFHDRPPRRLPGGTRTFLILASILGLTPEEDF